LIEMLGYSRDEFLGKKLWEIGPIKDVIAGQAAFQELQYAEYIRYENLPLETRQGDRINVEFVSNLYRVDGMKVIQCNVRDITHRRKAEKALEQAHTSLGDRLVDLQQRNREISLLGETSNLLQSCVTASEAYTVSGQFVPQLFPAESGSVGLLDTVHNMIKTGVRWGEQLSTPGEQMFEPDACWALRRGRLHHVQNTEAGLLCKHLSIPLPTAYLCIPLSAQNETFGLLHLSVPAGTSTRLTQEKQQLAITLAEHVSLALANLKLRETLHSQSVRDPLTGLFNRRYMEESLEREIYRAKRGHHPLGIIMLDLDNFKQFNDNFGHEAGDLFLREVGNFLQRHIRRQDIACRYGGEEFMLILPEASLEVTHQRAENLRERFNHLQIDYHGQVLSSLTLSIGVAALPEHGSTSEAVLRAADLALYQAKAGGRNSVSIAQSP
jgi:diguanylate cyclase (GGDEF)-like protein/PAS domain S-box-containing protein